MADGTKTRGPASLDALLSANRESFDQLFRHQMAGGRAAGTTAAAPPPAPPAPAPAQPDTGENVIAELNRLFATNWSAEIVERKIQDGRAIVTGRLSVGDQHQTETGTSRIHDDGDQGAAVQRAYDRALQKCAARLQGGEAPKVAPAARTANVDHGPADVVTINRIEIALANVRREMAAVLARSALSSMPAGGPTGQAMIMDGRGAMISGRSGSYLAHMLQTRSLHFAPGDVLLISDPFASGGATGDVNGWLVVIPVFHGPDLVGFASMHGRMTDVGGTVDGSRPATATSVFAEGVRIPPVKIVGAGTLNKAALEIVLANSRSPQANRADLMALIAGCRAGEAGVLRLCQRIGPEVYHRACSALLGRTNRAMRRVIVDTIPEEPQSFEDQIDDDGCGNGPFTLRLTTWREGDHAYFDWTGTSAQAPGPVNFFLHVGLAKTFVGQYLMRAFAPQVPCNDGFYDLIHVVLPGGTLLNPAAPAAVGRSEHALVRHLEVLGGAVDRHVPDRLPAAGYGSTPTFIYSGDGFRMTDPVFGGLPGRADGDGMDGGSLWPGDLTTPAEHLEGQYPVVVERCAAIPDTGGAGLHRGGNGVEKVYRVLRPGVVSIHDDRHLSAPFGVNGGGAGAKSDKWIDRAEGGREDLPSKVEALAVMPNDRITFRTAGGGGWGNPLERDPERVRLDVVWGLSSAEAAGSDYGVVLRGEALHVDLRATEEFRNGLMRDRTPRKLFDRGGPA